MFHPTHTFISKFVTDFEAREVHHTIFQDGELCYSLPSLPEIREFAKENLALLWDEYKRSKLPEQYPVDLSQACWDNKMKKIESVKEKVQKMISK